MRPIDRNNEIPPTYVSNKKSIINIQLSYDLQASIEPDLWSGSFHPISLHGLIEHFALNAKNIKVILDFMAKYIINKQVNNSRANDLNDFNGMGDAIWKFISSVYEAKWDSLYTNNKTNTLRVKFSSKQINRVNNIIKGNSKPKSRIQMIMKGPFRKQIIVIMSGDNFNSFMKNSSTHVSNLNRLLRNVKMEVVVDFIRSDPIGLVIVTNKVTIQSNLQIINQYVKKLEDINELQVEKSRLPQSKSYLKITDIPYFPNGRTQERLNTSDVETVLKQNQIFNDIKLASRPRVIKVSPKSDMLIV